MTCLMLPLAELSWQVGVGDAADVPDVPLVERAAARLAAARHVSTAAQSSRTRRCFIDKPPIRSEWCLPDRILTTPRSERVSMRRRIRVRLGAAGLPD